MKILLLTNYWPPEIGGAAHLFFELASELARRGHQVAVVTGFPRYNVEDDDPSHAGKLVLTEEMNGVRVLRVRTVPFPKGSKVGRGLDHFAVAAVFGLRALFAERQDVVLAYSPPLPLGLTAYALAKLTGAKAVLNVQDLFPQEAIDLGIMTNPFLIRLFEALEHFVYRHVDHVTVHSHGNRGHVISRGGGDERITVVHNWVDTERMAPGCRDNGFRRDHGLSDRFVVSYAGTMGWCQDMGIILRAAERLREQEDILFLLVGDGVQKAEAEATVRARNLSNVRFLPMQPWEVYPSILHASDVCLINLNRNLRTPVVPSKLLNIMSTARPVVASLPLQGDAPRIIEEAGCGFAVAPEDVEGLVAAILQMYRDLDLGKAMGRAGREYALRHFSLQACVAQYDSIFAELVHG